MVVEPKPYRTPVVQQQPRQEEEPVGAKRACSTLWRDRANYVVGEAGACLSEEKAASFPPACVETFRNTPRTGQLPTVDSDATGRGLTVQVSHVLLPLHYQQLLGNKKNGVAAQHQY